jgi:ABC-type transport system substrate-binding protein
MDRVRASRPLPALGIEAPDPRTLVLSLNRPDARILERLASPGVGEPWKRRGGAWSGAVGLGPYRVATEEPGRALTLVRAGASAPAAYDTVLARFVLGAPRMRTLLRRGSPDLAWPLPPALTGQALPAGYAYGTLAASPPRRLLLVFRADVPPTTRLPARHALAHALNRETLLESLGERAGARDEWLEGAGPFDFPSLDASEVRAWLDRGHLGVSFHVVLAFDADGAGAEVARALQGQWASLGIYAELRSLRGADALAEPLRAAAAQAQLVEVQAPLPGADAELATLVMPLRGAAVGGVRTGWRTREFDPWLAATGAAGPIDAAAAQARLAEERVALPLARLPWRWVERSGGGLRVHFAPAEGPDLARR